jgi:hypothetical protein
MYGPYFNNLARVFYTTASGIYMPCIYILSVILYLLFIKYFKFYTKKKNLYIRCIYINLVG